jgi:hypothetical protein
MVVEGVSVSEIEKKAPLHGHCRQRRSPLLRIHGVTNVAAEPRRRNGSDREVLKRMGLSTG